LSKCIMSRLSCLLRVRRSPAAMASSSSARCCQSIDSSCCRRSAEAWSSSHPWKSASIRIGDSCRTAPRWPSVALPIASMVFGFANGESFGASGFESLDAPNQHSAAARLRPTRRAWDTSPDRWADAGCLSRSPFRGITALDILFFRSSRSLLITSFKRGIRSFSL